jgi:5-methylthioadenosine/S-adenosylhomocysteine deaminase
MKESIGRGAIALRGCLLLAAMTLPWNSQAAVTVTVGDTAELYRLTGRIVTPLGVIDGEVVIRGDTITCVAATCAAEAGATHIRVSDAYIVPGFIDPHNHVAYNVFGKWQPPKLYENRYQWQRSASYKAFKAPYNDLKASVYCEMVKYGELKALMSGITTIQGTSPNRNCFRMLVRNAENQSELNLPANHIRTSILGIDSFRDSVDWDQTKAFVVHLAEGVDESSRAEFQTLKQKKLLHANTTVIHGTAFTAQEFTEMAAVGARLVWSPKSNLALYGATTNIKAALDAGVKVALGVDWNPTGSNNIFDELRVAEAANREEFGGVIKEDQWLDLVTENAADALGLGDKIGSIAEGMKGDLIVLQHRDSDANESILKNSLQDVQLVMIAGQPLYGNRVAMNKLRSTECEDLTVHGSRKRICVRSSNGVEKSSQTLAEIRQILLSRYRNLAPLDP